MDLWDLKDALSANRINDDDLYAVDELDGLKIKGGFFKKRGFLHMIEGHIHWRKDNPDTVARYYPNMYHWQVYQYDPDELTYELSPEFGGVKEVAKELQLPKDKDVYYRTRIFTGDSFCLDGKPVPDVFRQYTVEALGVRIKPLHPLIAEAMGTNLPDYYNYTHLPIVFQEKDSFLTVVWRLRIFACPIERFVFSPSTPLAPARPEVLYFEHRWQPPGVIDETFKNVDKVRTNNPGLFDRFKTDTFFLLSAHSRRGRNPNSGAFPAKEEFLKKRSEAQDRFGGTEPSIEVLARFFGVTPGTYNRHANLYEVSPELYAKNDEDGIDKE
jgi:hypothetical protein